MRVCVWQAVREYTLALDMQSSSKQKKKKKEIY